MATRERPHLLYVAWGYPPARGGGVYRALATPNAFAREGWQVTVLTATRETFLSSTGIDPTLESEIHPNIVVERIPFDVPAYQSDIHKWSWFRANFPELWNSWASRRNNRIFPESIYGGWRSALEKKAFEIHRSHAVDLVIGTANPNVDLTPGLALNQEHGVPFVIDYRDAWQLDVFTGNRLTRPRSAVARIEAALVTASQEAWFVNEPIRDWHASLYPDQAHKFHVVSNGYDANFANFSTTVRSDRKQGLVFGYIGTISGMVPVRELLDGWRLARSQSVLLRQSRIEFYGYLNFDGIPNKRLLDLFTQFEDEGVTYKGPVGKARIASTYSSFDALLLVLGKGKYVTSGKVFEYAATGLPIASIHDPRNAATQVLEQYPAWVPAKSLDAESVSAALLRLSVLSTSQTEKSRAHNQAWASKYERSNQLDPRVEALTLAAKTRETS